MTSNPHERFDALVTMLDADEDHVLSLLLDTFGLWVMDNDDETWRKLFDLEMSL